MTDTTTPSADTATPPLQVTRLIGTGTRSARRWWLLAALALLLLAAVAAWLWQRQAAAPSQRYETTAARIGALVVKVSATGNLQPTNKVDVGSELSGTVEAVLVDDNSRVRKGQLLARLDVAKLQDQVQRSEATLAQAQAQVLQALATITESRAGLQRLQTVQRLSGGKVPAQAEITVAEATLERALAAEASARAAVLQAQATLRSDRTNVAKSSIRSPIDGVVLLRQVEPGQTVAASLQAPVLFTLAESLLQMELQVSVDEADVGQVKEGQRASFNVDAWPNRRYPATISRVSYGSQTTNNVVSYKTTLAVNNDDQSLRPGMTATAEIVTLERQGVLLVPNAALRYSPPVAAASGASTGSGIVSSLMPRPPRGAPKKATTSDAASGSTLTLWVLRDGQPVAVSVTVGATDGRLTEIAEVKAGTLKAGDEVITDSTSVAP